MEYAVYDFDEESIVGDTYWHHSIIPVMTDRQCRVSRGTTEEDIMYVGTEWACMHCIPPQKCTYCNPAYKDAVIKQCPNHKGKTWHVGNKCLHCKEESK